jgi:hypothetical protein
MTTPASAFGAAAKPSTNANPNTSNKLVFFIFVTSDLHKWKHGGLGKVALRG